MRAPAEIHAVPISAAGAGLALLALPLAWAPGWAYAVALAGAAAVLAAALGDWRPGPALAATAAIAECAFSRAGTLVLAAEGLLVLVYLLAAHAPVGLKRPGAWLRRQAFPAAAGVIASGAVLAALALHQVSSAWLTAVGLAAAAGAYLLALRLGRLARGSWPFPRKRRGGTSDVDIQ